MLETITIVIVFILLIVFLISIIAYALSRTDPKRKKLLKYLSAVYPAAIDELNQMSFTELDEFYNTLWFYYNCDYSGDTMIGAGAKQQEACWSKVCDVSLPYAPTGLVYSWASWNKNWSPMIISNPSLNLKTLGGSIPGQTFIPGTMGPSPVWQYARAIFRNIYTNPEEDDFRIPSILKGNISELVPPISTSIKLVDRSSIKRLH